MRNVIVATVCGLAATAALLMAQAKPAAPAAKPMAAASAITASERATFDTYKDYVVKSAAAMAEKDYASKPATQPAPDKKEIRTFAEILLHVAEEAPLFCAAAAGMKAPAAPPAAKTKAEIQKALADGLAVCDRAWASTTDANAGTPVEMPFNMGKSTRLGMLSFNTAHVAEHYGNLVTYLRVKGLVPPSSQPAGK